MKPTLLTGIAHAWAHLDIDALVAPLGLSGVYRVFGIDPKDEPPFPRNGTKAQMTEWHDARRKAQMFEITLTPPMTLLHIVQLAALEDRKRCRDWHVFFELIRIRGNTIEVSMGS